jgi:hypothetical protein
MSTNTSIKDDNSFLGWINVEELSCKNTLYYRGDWLSLRKIINIVSQSGT